jgi:two-component system, NtrC family, response regulator HydG
MGAKNMSATRSRILLIDDEPDICELLAMTLEEDGAEVVTTTSARDAFDRVANEEFDVVLTDLAMNEMGGLEVCQRIGGIHPNLPVIVVTGLGSMDAAISAMRAGAYDFITKPIDPKLLSISISRALEHKRAHAELKRLREAATTGAKADGIIGSSRAMRRVLDVIARVAESDAPVLIQGETGVGKEVTARRVHETSRFKGGPFVAINCAAVPAALLESELFGHVRGAFTDAKTERVGLFVRANGGTIFLDEIGDMPLEIQPKLLRALQERTVRPVGANAEIPFDARIIAASNRELEDEVEEKRFREDLYYRINVVRVTVPSLRERDGDVLELAQHFLAQHAARGAKPELRLSPEVAKKLMDYRWPGNVRELENCMARAVAFARFDELTVEDLPEKLRSYESDRFVVSANDEMEVVTLLELERRYVQRVLTLFNGNKARTAHALGIDRRTLYRKAEKWNEEGSSSKDDDDRSRTCPPN